jgi:hypothetical protein
MASNDAHSIHHPNEPVMLTAICAARPARSAAIAGLPHRATMMRACCRDALVIRKKKPA